MPCGVFRWTLVYFGVYTDPYSMIKLLALTPITELATLDSRPAIPSSVL